MAKLSGLPELTRRRLPDIVTPRALSPMTIPCSPVVDSGLVLNERVSSNSNVRKCSRGSGEETPWDSIIHKITRVDKIRVLIPHNAQGKGLGPSVPDNIVTNHHIRARVTGEGRISRIVEEIATDHDTP